MRIFLVSLILFSFHNAWAQRHPVKSSSSYTKSPQETEITVSTLGTLVVPPNTRACQTLKVFFPGHAQELGYKGEVPQNLEAKWAKYLLGPGGNYSLLPNIEAAGCPVLILGDSNRSISEAALKEFLNKAGVHQIEVLSHSGGYVGLSASLSKWGRDIVEKISQVSLLDNFYNSNLEDVLTSKIGSSRLREICRGFTTTHNRSRYESRFSSFCKKSEVPNLSSHKAPVKDYFK